MMLILFSNLNLKSRSKLPTINFHENWIVTTAKNKDDKLKMLQLFCCINILLAGKENVLWISAKKHTPKQA
jgi:hypothetical protein